MDLTVSRPVIYQVCYHYWP